MRAVSRICATLFAIVFTGLPATVSEVHAAPATFLDATAWLNAIGGMPGQGLAPVPRVSLDRMTFSDAFGTWTHTNQTVNYLDTDNSPATSTRTALYLQIHPYFFGSPPFPAAASFDGGFSVQFGCYTAVFPCIGLRTVEIDLGREIMGFGGHLDYYKGYSEYFSPSDPPIPLLADAYAAPPGPHPVSHHPDHRFFSGFFGAIFDQPTRVIRLGWWEHLHMDDSSSVRFTNSFIVTAVPEPAAVTLLAVALLGLLLTARCYGAAAPIASRKA